MSLVEESTCMCAQLLSRIQYFATPWTVDCQTPLSMGLSRQEYWSELPCPPSRDIPDPGIEPTSPVAPALQADSLLLSHQGSPNLIHLYINSGGIVGHRM